MFNDLASARPAAVPVRTCTGPRRGSRAGPRVHGRAHERTDARGCRISGAGSVAALEAYEAALAAFVGWRGGIDAALDTALAEAPGFVMAHLLRAWQLVCGRDPARIAGARAVFERVLPLPTNEREHQHLAAIGALLRDDYEGAKVRLGTLLEAHPRAHHVMAHVLEGAGRAGDGVPGCTSASAATAPTGSSPCTPGGTWRSSTWAPASRPRRCACTTGACAPGRRRRSPTSSTPRRSCGASSPPGRPKGEYRRAQPEGPPVSSSTRTPTNTVAAANPTPLLAIRDVQPHEAAALGALLVRVYAALPGFPTPAEQPA